MPGFGILDVTGRQRLPVIRNRKHLQKAASYVLSAAARQRTGHRNFDVPSLRPHVVEVKAVGNEAEQAQRQRELLSNRKATIISLKKGQAKKAARPKVRNPKAGRLALLVKSGFSEMSKHVFGEIMRDHGIR